LRESSVFRELLAVVERDAPSQGCGQIFHAASRDACRGRGAHVIGAADSEVAALSFHPCHKGASTPFSDDRVALPISVTTATIDHVGPSVDANALGEFAASFRGAPTTT
jgi:hypothetical protein